MISESKRYIPLFWLSFLSSGDIENAQHKGQFELDRKRAVERSTHSIPFFTALFPQVASFEELAESLLEKVRVKRSKTIGIEVTELLFDEPGSPLPNLTTAVEAIERRDTSYSLTVPARMVVNPFTGEEQEAREQSFASTQEMLLFVCWLDAGDLTSKSQERVRDSIVGYVWP